MKADVSDDDRSSLESMDSVACGLQPLQFHQVDDYTTFRAEYAWDGDDLVFHFFRLPDTQITPYWLQTFPAVLDPVAREHFRAEPPRLRAAYTEEVDSWWLRANGYGSILAKQAYVQKFLDRLDQTLDTKNST